MRLRVIIWSAIVVAVTAILCVTPLFNLLAYEFSFATGLLFSLVGVHLGAQRVIEARRTLTPAERALADTRPLRLVFAYWASAFALCLPLLAISLAMISLNGYRVTNCNYSAGLVWFGWLPLCTTLIASGWGVIAGLWSPSRRRVVATMIAVGIVLVSIAWALLRLLQPPIFVYDAFGGYFAGSLYDEGLDVPAPLFWARLYQLTAVVATLIFSAAFLDGLAMRVRWQARRTGLLLFAIVAAALGYAQYRQSDAHGFFRTKAQLVADLGGTYETEHFTLHYNANGPVAKDIQRIALDHEFRYAQLKERIGIAPAKKITSYIFDSAGEKRRLVGLQETSLSKPWKNEIYIQASPWPHEVLRHELAHIFAGSFGESLFHIPRNGILPNMGLLEGFAVAVDNSESPLTIHESVRAMREFGIRINPADLLSPKFFTQSAGAAYVTAGSFCRFLYDTYGIEKLRALYQRGGTEASFADIYHKPLPALVADWSHMIDAIEVPKDELEIVRDRYTQKAIFHKPCAHEIALLKVEAGRAQSQGRLDEAIRLRKEVCSEDRDDPRAYMELLDTANAAHHADDVRAVAAQILAHPKTSLSLRSVVHERLGDLALSQNDLPTARTELSAALELPRDVASKRLLTAKLRAATITDAAGGTLLRAYLLGAPNGDALATLLNARALAEKNPDDGFYHYLYGRQLNDHQRYADAIAEFTTARKLGLPDAHYDEEALRLTASAQIQMSAYTAAIETYRALMAIERQAARRDAQDMIERLEFLK